MDNRLIIRELCIELPSTADKSRAKRLGDDLARTLAEGLMELQERRLEPVLSGSRPATRVVVDRLKVVLRGGEASWPTPARVADLLVREVEMRLEPV